MIFLLLFYALYHTVFALHHTLIALYCTLATIYFLIYKYNEITRYKLLKIF